MNYRSVNDLNTTIKNGLCLLPDVAAVVALSPRSGLAAGLLASHLGVPNVSLGELASEAGLTTTRRNRDPAGTAAPEGRIAVFGDIAGGGRSVDIARERFSPLSPRHEIVFAAAYASAAHRHGLDVAFEDLEPPSVAEWNVMHDEQLLTMCVDIDGILCPDPTVEQNDDGPRYEQFLRGAPPRWTPSQRIGWLVTSRLERYRGLTEAWLERRGVRYGELIMLDLPTAAARRASQAHGTFKAEVYGQVDASLFIESEGWQAEQIAALAGKPVLCLPRGTWVEPGRSPDRRLSARVRRGLIRRLSAGLPAP